jgi:hypothetical protein
MVFWPDIVWCPAMRSLFRRNAPLLAGLAAAVLAGASAPAVAQNAPRVRGTITGLQGDDLLVKTKDDQELAVRLVRPTTMTARIKADPSAIKPGVFVGAAAVPGKGGALAGVEIVIFPEAMRGAGEGHRAWEPLPEGTMTNATVADEVSATDGRSLKLSYKGGEQTIAITPETRVFTLGDATLADLKPGAPVSFGVEKDADGHLQTKRLTVDR